MDGSTKLANSWTVGRRQPLRLPRVLWLQLSLATAQSTAVVLGDFSQTNPVSLSRTARLEYEASTVNRPAPIGSPHVSAKTETEPKPGARELWGWFDAELAWRDVFFERNVEWDTHDLSHKSGGHFRSRDMDV
jgi:hypothetical protein